MNFNDNRQVGGVAANGAGSSEPGLGGEEANSLLDRENHPRGAPKGGNSARVIDTETKTNEGKRTPNKQGRQAKPAKNEPKKKGGKQANNCKGPRGNANQVTIEFAVRDEAMKAAPALDTPVDKPAKPEFVPTYSEFKLINICEVTDVSIFNIFVDDFADHKICDFYDAVSQFHVREFKPITIDWDEVGRRVSKYTTRATEYLNDYLNPPSLDSYGFEIIDSSEPGVCVISDPFDLAYERKDDGSFDLQPIPPARQSVVKDFGNFHKCVYDVATSCVSVVEPIVDLANPLNYIKLAIHASQVSEIQLCAQKVGEEVYPDTRPVDLRENERLIPDTVYKYQYYVQFTVNGRVQYLHPRYFPEVSTAQPSLFNRLFYRSPEATYKYFSLSLNLLTDLYGPKTCSAMDKEDSLVVAKRVFKSNNHNTFLNGRLNGDRILDDNYLVALRICQNSYHPVTKSSPVK